MDARLKVLLSPLNFAGYLAWGAIGWELLYSRGRPAGGLAYVAPDWLLLALHLGFLALFMAVTSGIGTLNGKRLMILGQVVIAFMLMLLARNGTLPILLILCAIQVVQASPPRISLLVMLAINVGMYLVFRDVWQLSSPVITSLMNASFQAFAALTAWFAFSAERARDQLATVNADLLATRTLLAESTRDSERLRLSRELHDVAGHKLTALKLNLAALARQPQLLGDDRVQLCARLADELLTDIRGVVQQLRQDEGLDLGEALHALARPFPRPRLELEILDDARVVTLTQAEAVLRAVQEGLTNAARHSQAQTLWVVLRREGDALLLDIRDDGRGRGELQPGNGLRGMRERFETIGGGLRVQRTRTGGVHLQAWLPAAA